MSNTRKTYSAKELAQVLGCSPKSISEAIANGTLKASKRACGWCIPKDQDEAFEALKHPGTKPAKKQDAEKKDTYTMRESLIQVTSEMERAERILKRNGLYDVVARVNGEFDEETKTYWFSNSGGPNSLIGKPDLQSLGHYVPKNSYIAKRILNSKIGREIVYESMTTYKRMLEHRIVAHNKVDRTNKQIFLDDDDQVYTYTDISLFLKVLRQKDEEIRENKRRQEEQRRRIEELKAEKETAHQRAVLTKELNKLKEEQRILTLQQEAMENLTQYIRKQGQLRFNPILDPVQSRIKTGHLYDGQTVIINGGPGTGKTTTMVQRLKYLTDEGAITEDVAMGYGDFSLNAAQREKLFEAMRDNKDWMFFSPSELLKDYLADAMNREGLASTGSKVWSWDEYRTKIFRDEYGFIDPSNIEKSPFRASKSKDTLIYKGREAIREWEEYFVSLLKEIPKKLPRIDENSQRYEWVAIAEDIAHRLENVDSYSLDMFMNLFISLESVYGKRCKELLAGNNENVRTISEELLALVNGNRSAKNMLERILVSNVQEVTDTDADEDEDSEDEEELGDRMLQQIRNWLRRFCYSKKNRDVKLTPRQLQVGAIVQPLLLPEHSSQLGRIGDLMVFEQYARYTRGIKSTMLSNMPSKYKRFRKYVLITKSENWNLELLDSLTKRREGKELHPQEQSLLIGFVNNLVKRIKRITLREVHHPYIDAYARLSRYIIGIDEVTDFSECDIYAMESLLSTDFNSLTLSGDMMQRLTEGGLRDWNELEELVRNPVVVDMKTSYRQSQRLLEVAKELYKDTLGEEPNYNAYMKSKRVPAPLGYVSADEENKIDWIERRINEIYVAYGKRLPSIAIFLNNKLEIPGFVERLKDTDFITDAGIVVVDGSAGNVLASDNQIRVYPIEVVKGMEFDAVFFHNIDNANVETELLKRYIYVGVSRAAFFLAATFNRRNAAIDKYFDFEKKWDKV